MKTKSPLILGMTVIQVSILAGLAGLAGLSILGMFWLILSVSSSSSVPAPQPAVAVQTKIPTPTATATISPSATPEATVTATVPVPITPPDGWVSFETDGIKISLPGSYVGGDMLQKRSETIKKIESQLKTKLTKDSKIIDENVLLIVDKNNTSYTITTVAVFLFKTDETTTLDEFVKQDLNQPEIVLSASVSSRKKLSIAGHEAIRLELEYREVARSFSKVIYYIKDDNSIWSVGYTFDPSIVLDITPIITTSIKTLDLTK